MHAYACWKMVQFIEETMLFCASDLHRCACIVQWIGSHPCPNIPGHWCLIPSLWVYQEISQLCHIAAPSLCMCSYVFGPSCPCTYVMRWMGHPPFVVLFHIVTFSACIWLPYLCLVVNWNYCVLCLTQIIKTTMVNKTILWATVLRIHFGLSK